MLKKHWKVTGAVLLAMLFGVCLLPSGMAIAENEIVLNEDINKAAGNLVINRNTVVNGNVNLNLGELVVDGVVNGDVSSNMAQVMINGDVNGNVETNMGQIVVDGNVSGDVRSRMGEIAINGSVGGDVGSGFGELLISGAIAGSVYSKGGNINITGIVDGDVTLGQGLVEIGPQGVINGRLYVERGLIKKADTAQIGAVEIKEELTASELQEGRDDRGYRFDGVNGNFVGKVIDRADRSVDIAFRNFSFTPDMMRIKEWTAYPFPPGGLFGDIARGIITMLIMFALAALTYTLFPTQVKAAGDAVATKSGPVIGWGLLVALLAIPFMVLLAITIIGIPLIIVVIIVLALAALLGYTGIAMLVGEKIVRAASNRPVSPLGAVVIGILVLGLVTMVPVLGWLVSMALWILALGAALMSRGGLAKPNMIAITMKPAETEATAGTEVKKEDS